MWRRKAWDGMGGGEGSKQVMKRRELLWNGKVRVKKEIIIGYERKVGSVR